MSPPARRSVTSLALALLLGFVGRGAADEPPAATPAPVASPTTNAGTERSMARRSRTPEPYQGSLSAQFPEVELRVSISFAHDAGIISRVESIQVAGRETPADQVLAALVAHRGGWTREGGRSEADALRTVEAYGRAWLERRGTNYFDGPTPDDWRGYPGAPEYHPPRVSSHTLPDGQRVVAFAFWHTYDGGDAGDVLVRTVGVYRVADGSEWVPPEAGRGPGGPPPQDGIPRTWSWR